MIRPLLLAFLSYFVSWHCCAQEHKIPALMYHAKVTFQAYGLPTQNVTKGFKNIGVALGVDVAYNSKRNLQQSFTLGYQAHSQHETNYYLNTQLQYRPIIGNHCEPNIGIGVGRVIAISNPKNRFYELNKSGTWTKSDRQSTGHWQVPITIGFGYRIETPNTVLVPFLNYDIAAIIKYNSAFIALPYTIITAGTRIGLKH